jgi:hypothetical protein
MNERLLHSFARISQELTHALKTDCNLTELDQLRLENYFWMMHIAYAEWKQRHGRPPTYWADPAQESHRDDNDSRASP